ncbi:MAG: exonuclease SbcCD subunit D [Deltaproteobacteria bacterium]|nr:exonuclease SbcCD subunit D [Deltaproteobacteria bacterium]
MRILHTSDWHIGKLFEGHHLTEDQAFTLDGFVALAEELRPDVIVIAGDLYDRAVPPPEAVELLDRTLRRLVLQLKLPTVAIAGNHDSAERIGFGSALLESAGLLLAGDPIGRRSLTLRDEHGEVDIVPIPFATPEALRSALRGADADADVQGFAAAMQRQVQAVTAGPPSGRRRVAVAHAFVKGGSTSESERALQVGGTGDVPAEAFDGIDGAAGFDYVALGHLHRPQQVDAARRGLSMRYSGSLLPYSFSEIDHEKSVSLVTLGAPGAFGARCELAIETFALPQRRRMRKIEGTLDALLDAGQQESESARQDYVWAALTDDGLVHDAMPRLRRVYPNAVKISRPVWEAAAVQSERRDHRKVDPVEIFSDFWAALGHTEGLDDARREVVTQAVQQAMGKEVAR